MAGPLYDLLPTGEASSDELLGSSRAAMADRGAARSLIPLLVDERHGPGRGGANPAAAVIAPRHQLRDFGRKALIHA